MGAWTPRVAIKSNYDHWPVSDAPPAFQVPVRRDGYWSPIDVSGNYIVWSDAEWQPRHLRYNLATQQQFRSVESGG